MTKKIIILFFILLFIFILVLNFDYLRPFGCFLVGICGWKTPDNSEINVLKSENFLLKIQIEELREVKNENEFLRNFLDLEKLAAFKYVLADVVLRSPFNFSQTFTINKGTQSGIKEGDAAVLAGNILLGKIKKTEENSSAIQTLFDESLKIDVLIGEKTIGLLKGEQSKIVIESISKNDNIGKGDLVKVSALNEEYPKGLIVGEIKNIIDEPQALFKKAEVEAPYNWMEIERVMVLTK